MTFLLAGLFVLKTYRVTTLSQSNDPNTVHVLRIQSANQQEASESCFNTGVVELLEVLLVVVDGKLTI